MQRAGGYLDGGSNPGLQSKRRICPIRYGRLMSAAHQPYHYSSISTLPINTASHSFFLFVCLFGGTFRTYPGWGSIIRMPTSFKNIQSKLEYIISLQRPCPQQKIPRHKTRQTINVSLSNKRAIIS